MTKVSTGNTEPRLPWAGKQVRMEDVEETLAQLWHLSADNVRIGQNIRVRTSVLNFVICAPNLAAAQHASAGLRNLGSTHIGRVILLILNPDPGAPPGVSTWVTLRSFPIVSDMMRHTFEQVTVLLSGSAASAADTILQPLFKPDLPVYLWWLQDVPTDNPLFHHLANSSSRVIVDSHGFFQPEASLMQLAQISRALRDSALSDLNWSRITHWRQLVAQFFDVPAYQRYLEGVFRIEVEHSVLPTDSAEDTQPARSPIAGATVNATRALLLAAWLKTSLNWHIDPSHPDNYRDPETGAYTWHTLHRTGPLHFIPTEETAEGLYPEPVISHSGEGTIFVRPRVQPGLPPGSICLVRLSSTVDGKLATFTVNRTDDREHALTVVTLPEGASPPRTVPIPGTQPAIDLLHEELEIIGRDHLYEDTLQEVYQLLSEI
uniref:Glucose-6-phosphate dehydrogenase n=1 Tax=Thermosporothrix sp. COM3 TaxID=2490863 RepID=A0A455SNB2_9CHLR|nr:hypothetical protein KTC_36490 [Thermosporothrix sp. COM3]